MPFIFLLYFYWLFDMQDFLKIQLNCQIFPLTWEIFTHLYVMKDSPCFLLVFVQFHLLHSDLLPFLEFTPVYNMQRTPFLSFSYSLSQHRFLKSICPLISDVAFIMGLNFHVRLSLFLIFLFGSISLSVYSLVNIIFFYL